MIFKTKYKFRDTIVALSKTNLQAVLRDRLEFTEGDVDWSFINWKKKLKKQGRQSLS
jgi:hypothetical protein